MLPAFCVSNCVTSFGLALTLLCLAGLGFVALAAAVDVAAAIAAAPVAPVMSINAQVVNKFRQVATALRIALINCT